MWRSSQASTYVCRVPCKRLLWSTSLPRKVLLSTGIRQHVFSCRLKGDSNRKSLCSDQIFGYFSSYLTTISRKQYGQSSCNGCSRHLTSHSLTSTVADCFSSSPDSDFSHSLIDFLRNSFDTTALIASSCISVNELLVSHLHFSRAS